MSHSPVSDGEIYGHGTAASQRRSGVLDRLASRMARSVRRKAAKLAARLRRGR
ncbi:MAG: hypothetical protein KDB21_02530 [Acidimicrobiales bacterium]|nr:hypothetical protein [Acidimicrobiales bacterium]